MKKTRIGKDSLVCWPILTNGISESLDGCTLRLFIKSQYSTAFAAMEEATNDVAEAAAEESFVDPSAK